MVLFEILLDWKKHPNKHRKLISVTFGTFSAILFFISLSMVFFIYESYNYILEQILVTSIILGMVIGTISYMTLIVLR